MRKIPIRKIVGSPWKEGEIRLEVDKITSKYFVPLTDPPNFLEVATCQQLMLSRLKFIKFEDL